MPAPLIAIPAPHLRPGRVKGWTPGAYAVSELYVDAVRRAGGRPILLTSPDDASPEEVLEPFDGLLLVGGGDIDPFLYDTEPHDALYGMDRGRDLFEVGLMQTAAEVRRMPVLAICRGIQIANVAFGGTLHQHLPDLGIEEHGHPQDDGYVHVGVEIDEGSTLAEIVGNTHVEASCSHHQAVDSIGDGLHTVGRGTGGIVEALETDGDGWLIAVQWHPEVTAATDPGQQALFTALVRESSAGS